MAEEGLLIDLDVDDLAAASFMDEATIVSILRCRYRKQKTFTFIGEILLSLNPFDQKIRKSSKMDLSNPNIRPDISITAERVYKGMTTSKRSQCCIFSGESGSGKTEASKMFLSHMIKQCQGDLELEEKLELLNPLLEAFGNAKTLLNNNSSRFAKFIQLSFNENGQINGAKIYEYLLEKSRVTRQNPGERNFHIFHVLMEKCSSDKLGKFKLDNSKNYGYLESGHSGSFPRTGNESSWSFFGLTNGLTTIGFTDYEQECIFSILAAILNLGNISPSCGQSFPADSQKFIKNSAKLLSIDRDNLCNQLQNLEIYSRGEVISRPYTIAEAEDCRDSISKALYNRLFGWIIHRINQVLIPKKSTRQQQNLTVGILDIFGFENLNNNSFEQLCINLANEQLHNFFNTKIFQQEQQEYQNEGICTDFISYRDNSDLLNMFLDRPIGILSLIDEESHFPQGTDASLVTKFIRHFRSQYQSRFHSSFHPDHRKNPQPTFIVSHYAGKVTYNTTGFLEKNRDSLPDRLVVLLQSSRHPIVSSLFTANLTRTGSLLFNNNLEQKQSVGGEISVQLFGRSTRKRLTLGYQFRTSLSALLEKLNHSEPHYVRCIKSNPEQKAGVFDSAFVLNQLRNAGILETIWMRQHGFSYRPTFGEFYQRFRGLHNSSIPDAARMIDSVLVPYGSETWCLGKTRVFIKCQAADDLAGRIGLREAAAKRVQKWYRGHLWRRKRAELKRLQMKSENNSTMEYSSDNSSASRSEENYSMVDSYEVCQWFKDCVYDQLNPSRRLVQPKWFFESLSRDDAEVLLRNQAVGCFLVRVGQNTSNVLVLSFRAPERCRHYLIDRVEQDMLLVRGERELHRDLASLLDYYSRYPLSNYTGCLSHFYGHQQLGNKMKNHPAEYDQLPPPNIIPGKTRRGQGDGITSAAAHKARRKNVCT